MYKHALYKDEVMYMYTMITIDESVLRDLKALLLEAIQKVPPFLTQLDALSDDLIDLGGACYICHNTYLCVSMQLLLHCR